MLANPFFSNAATAVDPGGFVFRAAVNAGLDVVASGGGGNASCTIQPNCYATPVTLLTDVYASSSVAPVVNPLNVQTNGAGNASQTVLNFTDTATVKFTNPSGGVESATVPTASNSALGVAECDGTTITCPAGVFSASPSLAVQTNGTPNTSQTVLNHVDTASVKWSNPSGGIEEATASVQGGVNMDIVPPIAGQYVVIYPTSVTTAQTGAMVTTANNTSAQLSYAQNCAFSSSGSATWTGFTLPSYVLAANVTAVYAFGFSADTLGAVGGGSCINPLAPVTADGTVTATGTGSTSPHIYGTSSGWTVQQFTGLMSGLTGANVTTAQIQAAMSVSGDWQAGQTLNVPLVGLIVYYTGTAPPADTTFHVAPPLYYNPDLNILSIGPDATFFASKLFSAPSIVNLPLASANTGVLIPIEDGTSATDCTTGGGTTYVLCRSTGSAWTAAGGGGLTTNALTAAATGGAAPGSTFNGSAAVTFDHHSFGAPGISGTPTTGNCVDWASATTLGDTGSPCGSGSGAVTQIVAGTNVTISPSGGTGAVTINASASGGLCSATVSNTASDIGAQINSAVTAVGSAGGNICIAPGTYTMSTTGTIAATGFNISLIGAGSNATQINCTVAGDCLVYSMPGTGSRGNTSTQVSNFSIIGNGASGQIPIHFKDVRGTYLRDVFIDHSGATAPCVEFENVTAWTEENWMWPSFGTSCFAAIQMFEDAALGTTSFGYNHLFPFVAVGSGQYGLYIPIASSSADLYAGEIHFTGNLNSGGTLIYNHAFKIGQAAGMWEPEDITAKTEGTAGANIWDVDNGLAQTFTSSQSIDANGANQGTAFNSNFYPLGPYNGLLRGNVYSGSPLIPASAFCPSMGTSAECDSLLGLSNTTYNAAAMYFYNNGVGSSNNRMVFKLVGGALAFEYDGLGDVYLDQVKNAPSLKTDSNGNILAGTASAWTNMTGAVTVTGCTVSSGACTVSGGATTVVEFSSIPATYNRLQIVIYGQGGNIATTFNGDTAANYAITGVAQYNTGGITNNNAVGQSSCGSGLGSTGVSTNTFDIPFYANTAFAKIMNYNVGIMPQVSSLTGSVYQQGPCSWSGTAAINSVTMTGASTYAAGTEFMILGQN